MPIYLRTNGVHAELILPTRAGNTDWSIEHPPAHMRSLSEPLEWVAFGWGDRGFFAQTPTWADLKPGTALMALSGFGPGAMHVEYIESPRSYKAREVRVSPEQYARLVAFIRGSFERDATGRPHRTNLPGYFSKRRVLRSKQWLQVLVHVQRLGAQRTNRCGRASAAMVAV